MSASLTGIPSNEFVGQPSITGALDLQGIASDEQVGMPALVWVSGEALTLQLHGIISAEAVGIPTIVFVSDPPASRETRQPVGHFITLEEDEDDIILTMAHLTVA